MHKPTIVRRQGSQIVRGKEYPIYMCENCYHLVPREEEVICWACEGEGEMTYLSTIIMQDNALPDTFMD